MCQGPGLVIPPQMSSRSAADAVGPQPGEAQRPGNAPAAGGAACDPQHVAAAAAVDQQPAADGSEHHFARRLVFYNADVEVPEAALVAMFAQHGEVTGLSVVRSAVGAPSGCGHVTFSSAEGASAALAALQGTSQCAETGCALGLLLVEGACAGSIPANISAAANGDPAKMSRTVFFTKVPPTVSSAQLTQLFSAVGEVAALELFIPWPGAKISKGCGLVEYAHPGAAAAAVHSLNHKFTWPHSHSALVVEWVDRSRQSANGKAAKAARAAAAAAAAAHSNAHAGLVHAPPHAAGAGMPNAGMLSGRLSLMQQQQLMQQMQMQQMQMQQQQQQAAVQQPQQQQQLGSSRSCPLPQLPPGWQIIGTTQQLPPAAGSAAGMVPAAAAGPAAVLQHQRRLLPSMAAGGAWSNSSDSLSSAWSVQSEAAPRASSTTSSIYDVSGSSSSQCSASVLQSVPAASSAWDQQQQAQMLALQQQQQQQQQLVQELAAYGGHNQALQQMLQQNVLLLQAINSPINDKTPRMQQQQQQQQILQLQAGLRGNTALASTGGVLLPVSADPPAPYSASQGILAPPMGVGAQPPLQLQQQQRVALAGVGAGGAATCVALPLSQRQMSAMSAVLPELPKLAGAQAWISPPPQPGGALQLVLSGSLAQVQAAYTAAGMLLSSAGVDEPLPLALVQPGGAL